METATDAVSMTMTAVDDQNFPLNCRSHKKGIQTTGDVGKLFSNSCWVIIDLFCPPSG
jgi:hypothetical protein